MLRSHWLLDPEVSFLNHGSFGATPTAVLDRQSEIRDQMEAEPVRFFERDLEPMWNAAQQALADFVGAAVDDIAFVTNATAGVNAVLRSLSFEPGSEIIVTNHAYDACRNAVDYVAARENVTVVVVPIPFPPDRQAAITDAIVEAVTPRTTLALIDHVTSATGLVFPIVDIVAELDQRGVDVLVDGAHAPGMLDLDIGSIGAAYYAGNCHKWMCAPKGVGFLHVRSDRQPAIVPTVISHGASSTRPDRSRFRQMFAWTGTADASAVLCVPTAIDAMESIVPGGWKEVRRRNHELAFAGGSVVGDAVGVGPAVAEDFVGSLMTIRLPDGPGRIHGTPGELQNRLLFRHRIEVPIVDWPATPQRLVRISAQVYNDESEYRALAEALAAELRHPGV